jgi:signal transduction histidine kinase
MKNMNEILIKEGFPFFGHINATISHELKNIMATISETSGLVNDLIEVSENGKNLDLDMIKNSSQAVIEEVQRGFLTIKQMNVFAHSIDNLLYEIDLADTIQLIINLSQFLSYSSQVEFRQDEKVQVKIFTCPFLLQNLVYQVLTYAYRIVGHKGVVDITLMQEIENNAIVFENLPFDEKSSFPDARMENIALVLGVSMTRHGDDKGLILKIPKNLTVCV